MSYSLDQFKSSAEEIRQRLVRELGGVRTGRASPVLLEGVRAEAYGRLASLRELGAIAVEDARTLKVTLWDKNQVKPVESAINRANLGVTASLQADGVSFRVAFPPLTEERRWLLIKVVKEKLEVARVALRQERDRVWQEIQDEARAGELSEDEKFRLKDGLQKLVDEFNLKFAEATGRKEAEVKG